MHILLPGPTPVPNAVEQAMLTAMTDHRGALFEEVQTRVVEKLAAVFGAPSGQHVAIFPASGTGGLEAAVQNLLAPGDRVLAVETGLFGRRFSEIAEAHGIIVDRLEIPWGQAFDTADVLSRLEGFAYRAVLLTHNETSTGVLNPVADVAAALKRAGSTILVLVDSISGVPSIPLTLEDGIDVVIAASQKGFMCPPGLTMLGFSDRGRDAVLAKRPGRFYFDCTPYLKGRLPYTPAISLWYGLDAALTLLAEEGEEARYARHRQLRDIVRAYATAGGLTPLVADEVASPTVTALQLPATLNPSQWRKALAARGLQISGGLGPWHDTVVRIGHVGYLDVADLWAGLALMAPELPHPNAALEAALQASFRHQ
ncbi:MAG: alanine--glyoxylate aminotransferase family protein [Firmicutes bacterium]|nr:alanine--glyoxylate aminotransferase family protein [Bacillota bacterium]